MGQGLAAIGFAVGCGMTMFDLNKKSDLMYMGIMIPIYAAIVCIGRGPLFVYISYHIFTDMLAAEYYTVFFLAIIGGICMAIFNFMMINNAIITGRKYWKLCWGTVTAEERKELVRQLTQEAATEPVLKMASFYSGVDLGADEMLNKKRA